MKNLPVALFLLLAVAPLRAAVILYSTVFTTSPAFQVNYSLVGQDGWVGTSSAAGHNAIYNLGSAPRAYIGLSTTAATASYAVVWHPTSYDPVASGNPLIDFQAQIALSPSTNGHNDRFGFVVYNQSGQPLGGIFFDTATGLALRSDGVQTYSLGAYDASRLDFIQQPIHFTIDYAANVWSAVYLNGDTPLFSSQSFTATAYTRNLGMIGASIDFASAATPGNNYLAIDSWKISALPVPEPGEITLLALGLVGVCLRHRARREQAPLLSSSSSHDPHYSRRK